MTHEINLYDGYYGHLATDPQVEVRRETYGEDLGQASWITASEAQPSVCLGSSCFLCCQDSAPGAAKQAV
jgi:hypothetical protein